MRSSDDGFNKKRKELNDAGKLTKEQEADLDNINPEDFTPPNKPLPSTPDLGRERSDSTFTDTNDSMTPTSQQTTPNESEWIKPVRSTATVQTQMGKGREAAHLEMAAAEEKKAKVFAEVLKEFYSTEASFRKMIEAFVSTCNEILKNKAKDLSPEQLQSFKNYLQPYQWIDEHPLLNNISVEDVLRLRDKSDWKGFADACVNHETANVFFKVLFAEHPKLGKKINEQIKALVRVDFDSILITPVQRGPRYQMLSEQLAKYAPADSKDKFKDLEKHFKAINDHNNERIRREGPNLKLQPFYALIEKESSYPSFSEKYKPIKEGLYTYENKMKMLVTIIREMNPTRPIGLFAPVENRKDQLSILEKIMVVQRWGHELAEMLNDLTTLNELKGEAKLAAENEMRSIGDEKTKKLAKEEFDRPNAEKYAKKYGAPTFCADLLELKDIIKELNLMDLNALTKPSSFQKHNKQYEKFFVKLLQLLPRIKDFESKPEYFDQDLSKAKLKPSIKIDELLIIDDKSSQLRPPAPLIPPAPRK